jgi:predicted SAM-dependent methyltransferase
MFSDRMRKIASRTYGRLAARSQITAYLRAAARPRLNLGCGHNILPEWLNVDLEGGRHGSVFMDASRDWPIANNAFDAILCEHLVEHLPKQSGKHILLEASRVLKPKGQIRVVTPDISSLAKLILKPACPTTGAYLKFVAAFHNKTNVSTVDAINYLFYEYGHRYIYSVAELKQHFEAAGFVDVRETRAGHPHSALFYEAEGHPNFMGLENDAFEAFGLEGSKPAVSAVNSIPV